MSVSFKEGYSIYDGIEVSDKNIVELTGLETYNTLHSISPNIYVEVTHPMYPTVYCEQLINSVLINNSYQPIDIKRDLVISYATGIPLKTIKPLIDSSVQPISYSSSFLGTSYFILLISVFSILTAWVLYITLTRDVTQIFVFKKKYPTNT